MLYHYTLFLFVAWLAVCAESTFIRQQFEQALQSAQTFISNQKHRKRLPTRNDGPMIYHNGEMAHQLFRDRNADSYNHFLRRYYKDRLAAVTIARTLGKSLSFTIDSSQKAPQQRSENELGSSFLISSVVQPGEEEEKDGMLDWMRDNDSEPGSGISSPRPLSPSLMKTPSLESKLSSIGLLSKSNLENAKIKLDAATRLDSITPATLRSPEYLEAFDKNLDQVNKDLHRTFTGANELLSEEEQKRMRQVLITIASRRKNTGYGQGMNNLAAALIRMNLSDSHVYATIQTIVSTNAQMVFNLEGLERPTISEVWPRNEITNLGYQFDRLLKIVDKELHAHFKSLYFNPELYVNNYLRSAFMVPIMKVNPATPLQRKALEQRFLQVLLSGISPNYKTNIMDFFGPLLAILYKNRDVMFAMRDADEVMVFLTIQADALTPFLENVDSFDMALHDVWDRLVAFNGRRNNNGAMDMMG